MHVCLTACSACPGVCSRGARTEAGGGASATPGLTLPQALGRAAKLAACLEHASAPSEPREAAQQAGADAGVPNAAARTALRELLGALVAAAAHDGMRAEAAAQQPFLPRLLPALCASAAGGCVRPSLIRASLQVAMITGDPQVCHGTACQPLGSHHQQTWDV